MGRITDLRQRAAVLVVYAVLHVLLEPAEGALVTAQGAPVLSFATGLLVAVLLTVGPSAALVAVLVRLLPLGLGADPSVVVADVLVVGVWTVVVLGVERTFRHFGPARTWRPMGSFLLATVVLGPALVVLVELVVVGSPVGAGRWLGLALGATTLAPGLRVAVLAPGRPGLVPRRALVSCGAFLAVLLLMRVLRLGVAGSGVTMFAVLLLVAGLGGYGAFVLSVGGGALALPVLFQLLPATPIAVIDVGQQFGWTVGVVCGLLLSIERDRRDDLASDLRAVFDGAATPTLVVRLGDLEVESANPAMVELVGPEALDGAAFLERIHRDDRLAVAPEQVARQALELGHGQMRLRAASGEWRQARWSARRISRTGVDRDAVLFQLVDVSQLHERSTALTRSNEALSRVAGRVSHDLKQPLSSISGYAETLREHAPRLDPAQVQLMAARLHDAALRATGYLDDLVHDARELGGEPRPVDVAAVLEQVEATHAIDLEDGVRVIDRRLLVPTVHARRGTVLAVLSNLVGNALKYGGDGPITVSTRPLAGGVRLTVEDEGVGIPVADLDRVFAAGVRLQASGDGTGAGLGEVRDRVEALGGRVRAVPMVGGARVDVWFPGPGDRAAPPHVSVLVAVADPEDAELLRTLLELDDAVEHVGHVRRGDELADACAVVVPDLLLLQRELVDGDALRHVGAVVEVAPTTQVVLYEPDTTGPAMDSLAAAVRRHGAAAGLTSDELDEQLPALLREMRRD